MTIQYTIIHDKKMEYDKARQYNTTKYKTRQDKPTHDNTRQGKTTYDKTRQDNIRQHERI